MAYCAQDSAALAAFALGGLDDDELHDVERHVAGCDRCRTELEELTQVRAALDLLPPEALLEGPPDGADLLLQRTLRAARAEQAGRRTTGRLARAVVAAGVAVAAALGAGVLVGRGTAPQQVATGPTTTASPTLPPEGTRYGSVLDPTSGARLTVRVEPAAGWVRVNAAVTGIPAGQRCRLMVIGRSGAREIAGSWLVSPAGARNGTTLNGSAIVAPDDVAAVRVENVEGRSFVTVTV